MQRPQSGAPQSGKRTSRGGLGVKTKGEGSVKINAEEPGGRVECKGGASQSEPGPMRGPTEVCTEKATPTSSGADWEAPRQRPPPKVIEGSLDRAGSPQWVRRGRPDGSAS